MSAGTVIDLFNNAQCTPSIVANSGGGPFPCSGAVIGNGVDLKDAHPFTNLFISHGIAASGQLRVAVQTSPDNVSGTFTDPTSGLEIMPGGFQSGGLFWINSGGANLQSGAMVGAGFLRKHRYARCMALSGDFFNAPFNAGFIEQKRSTGSGGGYSFSPGSGTVRV